MLIESSSSNSCRGWEENDCGMDEFEGTFKEWIISYISEEFNEEFNEEMCIKLFNSHMEDCFGYRLEIDEFIDGTISYLGYEGEESTVSWYPFVPTKEYIDMLIRNMEK